MQSVSQYEKYWLKLLAEGILIVQVPTPLVASIKKAIVARKYRYHQIHGRTFSPLKAATEAATRPDGTVIVDRTRITFTMHNLQLKDI